MNNETPRPDVMRGPNYRLHKHFVVYAANEDDTVETIAEIWAPDLAAATKRARQMFPDAADLYVMP